jgi:glycosyltransferase involved in cell wall biosynthesis
MDISVVIPLYNEEESLQPLFMWINRVMTEHKFSYEIIFVDDGSRDGSWGAIEQIGEEFPDNIKGVRFARNYGKSAALNVGFEYASGDVVITMDADLQDSPDEIPQLFEMIKNQKYDLVSGWKKKRYDSRLFKNLPSKFYNATTRLVSGIHLHDFNCGLKAYRKDVVKAIEVYGEMHRYIPVIAKGAGFERIGEKVVTHRKRQFGESKFGMNRFVHGYLDLMSIVFILRFGKKPMHFFGLWGSVMFIIGIALAVVMGIQKIIAIVEGNTMRLIANSPYFYIALTVMIIGCQLFLAGFIAEMIGRNSPTRNTYLINMKKNL